MIKFFTQLLEVSFVFGLYILFPVICSATTFENRNIGRKDSLFVNSDRCALFFTGDNEEFLKYKSIFQDKTIDLIAVDSIYSVINFSDGYSVNISHGRVNKQKILFYQHAKKEIWVIPDFIDVAESVYCQDNNYQYVIDDGCCILNDYGWACYNNNLEKVKQICEEKFDINSDAMLDLNFAYGALACAIYNGNIDIVKYLIENKIDVNRAHTEYLITPLSMVADVKESKKRIEIATLLIKAGADVNGAGKSSFGYGFYPLISAIEIGDVEFVRLLIINGATAQLKDEKEGYITSTINTLEVEKPIEAEEIKKMIKVENN
ncbi:MAG: ankyrin repeat domain-containing protein [Rikenellaceae bacterium]